MDIDEDEGFSDNPASPHPQHSGTVRTSTATAPTTHEGWQTIMNVSHLDRAQKGALAMELLNVLDFEQLSELHRRVMPMLKVDIVGILPTELALHVLSSLPVTSLLQASTVDRRWHTLCEAQVIWKSLCAERGWHWKYTPPQQPMDWCPERKAEVSGTLSHASVDEGFSDGDTDSPTIDIFPQFSASGSSLKKTGIDSLERRLHNAVRHSTPAVNLLPAGHLRTDYKLLFRTRTILDRRLRLGQCHLTIVNSPSVRSSLPADFSFGLGEHDAPEEEQTYGHTSTIYAICLANDVITGEPSLFTASRDQTILQWKISASSGTPGTSLEGRSSFPRWRSTSTSTLPLRVFQGAHSGSVLSVCVAAAFGFPVSGGSDGRIVVWDMRTALPIKILAEPEAHEDSVLCVRCDDKRLVSCSKDTTVRTFLLPSLQPHLVLRSHRAAVNALALSEGLIASASGDRSLRIWDSETGDLLHVYDGHHGRGLASIDFCFPNIVTGSSDRQIRYFDICTSRGWTTEAAAHVRRPRGFVNGHQEDDTTPAPWYRNRHAQRNRSSQNIASGPHFPAAPWTAPHTAVKYTAGATARWNELVRRGAPLSIADYSCSCGNNLLVSSSGGNVACGNGKATNANANVAGLLLEEACPTCGGAGHVHPTTPGPGSTSGVVWDGHQRATSGHGHGATRGHGDLVRAVAMNDNVVVSGSYDATIKVWDRRTGGFLAEFSNGHEGRIFGVAMDCTKLVSCGEDERICIWDFAWDMDTSFIQL